MTPGLERILTLGFGTGGNAANYLGVGWSGEEPDSRWMIGQGSEIWIEHPGLGPGRDLILEIDAGILRGPAENPNQRLAVGVRGKAIAQVLLGKGGTLGFHVPAALLDSPGPVRLSFIHPDFRRPVDIGAGSDVRELSFSVRALRLSRIQPRQAAAEKPVPPPDQMITRFESLGDNCEFGLVQRHLGAEPLGLFRFSFIELPDLLRGLGSGFEGLDDPAQTRVTIAGKDQEYVIYGDAYGVTYHTWQYADRIGLDAMTEQQVTRMRFLKRKFQEDLVGGEKIFVIKRLEPLRPEEVLPLYVALNERARNSLLWVIPADAAHTSGTVEWLLPGLLRGYIDRFSPYDNAPDVSLSAWTAVCEAAWRAVGGTAGPS